MRIIKKDERTVTFGSLPVGQVFKWIDASTLYYCIKINNHGYNNYNSLDLENYKLCAFASDDLVIPYPEATLTI